MIYGLCASQSVMLSEISHVLNEDIPLIKTENRLCRNLGKPELCPHLQRALASEQSPYIKQDSLLVLGLSDISKKYAQHMQYLRKVRDGSEGTIAKGYWTYQVLGIEGDQLIPLYDISILQKLLSFGVNTMRYSKLFNLFPIFVKTKGYGLSIEGEIEWAYLIIYWIILDHKQDFIIRLQQRRQSRLL